MILNIDEDVQNGKGNLNIAFGISEERSDELCDKLKDYINMCYSVPLPRSSSVVYRDVVAMCDTLEESVFLIIALCKFQAENNLPF